MRTVRIRKEQDSLTMSEEKEGGLVPLVYPLDEDQSVTRKRKLKTPSCDENTVVTSDFIHDMPKHLIITLEDIQRPSDTELPMKVNRYIKFILKLWEDLPSDLLLDTKKSLFPMLVKLRKNTLPVDHLTSLMTIFYHLQHKEYLKANESYMKLSIGNVAWPIGVISISIHARSTQSKLEGGKANIMIDEETRKWITAVKRLVTFMEKRD
jgi:pre-mRNA-splicing factor 18